uniref:Nucleolar protein 4-like isoform X1 n=1 Tax=Petromyzon marinus TaxID=7757 RepID=A0AAJ7TG34_PETMA|nr:nucleolar protein 4-like isoform X1 [Petromyzon marinus]XP_032817317.1 nucleolar protein 4-like isoform X1 [Petromyzon marinus]XP_032817319.1 nucleolar protein 4-like isoform X1 [Petromyzon marinus]
MSDPGTASPGHLTSSEPSSGEDNGMAFSHGQASPGERFSDSESSTLTSDPAEGGVAPGAGVRGPGATNGYGSPAPAFTALAPHAQRGVAAAPSVGRGPGRGPGLTGHGAPPEEEEDDDDDEAPRGRFKFSRAAPRELGGARGCVRPSGPPGPGGGGGGGGGGVREGSFVGGRADDDEDDHDDGDDGERLAESDGVDQERLKAFNMFVRLFVDENLDRMVPISKQPKEKVQAIIESCHRQFPEFQERARKRIRTYLKSCRRTRKHGSEQVGAAEEGTRRKCAATSRPPPAHLTSALAETILAAACESESRNAAKRMRIESQLQDEAADMHSQHALQPLDVLHAAVAGGVGGGGGGHPPFPAAPSPSPATFLPDPSGLVNGAARYGRHAYAGLPPPHVSALPPPSIPNGPTDLSVKRPVNGDAGVPEGGSAAGGAKGPHPPLTPGSVGCPTSGSLQQQQQQLSPVEVSAVRQLIAGYRESAAFLLRSADELENLILQQN